MKTREIITIILLFLLFFFLSPSSAQNLNVYELIGEKLSAVTAKFGKPVHQDKSNPAMECVFYKTKTFQMVFVANQQGVFQAEGCKSFDSKSAAVKELNNLVKDCNRSGYITDTLNVSEYNVHKKGVKFNLSLMENNFSKKYEVKIKANKSES
jgi:hypothetical protein